MTPRGRNYYDPILQTPSSIAGQEDKSRIEVFPVGMDSPSRLPSEIGKWASRRVDATGAVVEQGPSAGEQGEAIRQAETKWPGLEVYFLSAEIEDSTWEGMGPTPRLWQSPFEQPALQSNEEGLFGHEKIAGRPADLTPAVEPLTPEQEESLRSHGLLPEEAVLHAIRVQNPGTYVHLENVLQVLEGYAQQFAADSNPSAALGIREAAKALSEAFSF